MNRENASTQSKEIDEGINGLFEAITETFGVNLQNPSTRIATKQHVYRATYDDGVESNGVRTVTVFRKVVKGQDLDIYRLSIGGISSGTEVMEANAQNTEQDPIEGIEKISAMLEEYKRELR